MTHLKILYFGLILLAYQNCSRKVHHTLDQFPSEFQNIKIDEKTSNKIGPCEPSIAINPQNLDQLVAGAVINFVYHSNDGGKTWKKNTLESSMGVWGDPVIVADYKNRFYYAHLSDPSGKNWDDPTILDRIIVQKSEDGGKSWTDGSYAGFHHPKDQDKHWLAVDPQTNHIYMTWTEFDRYNSRNSEDHSRILFSKSIDKGETWSPTISLSQFEGNCLDDDQTTEGAVPAVGPNGGIYVAWAFDEKIYFDRSLDGGATWQGKDMIVTDQPGGWSINIPGLNRSNGMPVTGVDISDGPNRGTIYVNWSDQRNGEDDTDIWLAFSKDQGNTWSEPIRVNDDPAGKHNFLSWMSVDPVTGYLYIVFYDRRNYDDNRTDVYLAYSADGGKTFTNQKISESPFTPSSTVFFGDYNNIVSYNGRVRPIWTRYDSGKLSVWTALIDF